MPWEVISYGEGRDRRGGNTAQAEGAPGWQTFSVTNWLYVEALDAVVCHLYWKLCSLGGWWEQSGRALQWPHQEAFPVLSVHMTGQEPNPER